MSFIKDVCGGHDHIPTVWDDWLEVSGEMFVAEVDGKPMAMNRVGFLGDGAALLEGAGIHPELQEQRTSHPSKPELH